MARELEKRFQEAERLFKASRADAATRELRLLAEDSSSDLLLLNRIGDFLVRHGQRQEAIGLYQRVSEGFLRSGLVPKAVAVLKKMLRIEPEHLSAILLLADAHAKAQVVGDARAHLLACADRFLHARDLDRARQVYEKLVAIEPREPLHRVRLGETRALAGDPAGAADELVGAAAEFLAQEKGTEAEKTYRRAEELTPGRPESIAGIARALALNGRVEQAIAYLEAAAARPEIGNRVAGDLFFLYDQSGRTEQALRFLMDERADALGDDAIERMVREHALRDAPEQAWARVDLVLERWVAAGRLARVAPLLEKLASLEGQEQNALERLRETHRLSGEQAPLGTTLERLVRIYWADSKHSQASEALEELKRVWPQSELVADSLARERRSGPAAPAAPAARSPQPKASARPPLALPKTQADREFTAGHMTEAETLHKYGLASQAIAKVRLVTERFPGHVVAHEKLVELLRAEGDREAMRDALVALALARRSAEDEPGAFEALRLAQELGSLPSETLRDLEGAGLIAQPAAPSASTEDEDLEILFDEPQPAAGVDGLLSAPTAASGVQYPPPDAVEEIVFFLSQGMKKEAAQKIAALRKQGYGGNKLDDLERQASRSKLPVEELQKESSIARLDEETLLKISSSLESDLEAAAALDPGSPAVEQSLDEVFRAFKDQVAGEVHSGDFRTHYDLGIAYKEMGLVDDAIGEFTLASGSPDLFREASAMLALCHRERGDFGEAASHYRRALEAGVGEGVDPLSLRYELGEVLAEDGDLPGAVEMFEQVYRIDPAYRDVAERLSLLRSRDPS